MLRHHSSILRICASASGVPGPAGSPPLAQLVESHRCWTADPPRPVHVRLRRLIFAEVPVYRSYGAAYCSLDSGSGQGHCGSGHRDYTSGTPEDAHPALS